MGIKQIVSQINKKCDFNIFSNINEFSCPISCLVMPTITSNINIHSINNTNLNILSSITLADPQFNVSREVDLLIGASLFWDLIKEGKINLGPNLPTLQNIQFG